jgi:hypothetical protein
MVEKNAGHAHTFRPCAHVIAGEFRYVGKETDRKWEEGDDLSLWEFKTTEFGKVGSRAFSSGNYFADCL